jgi:hypothetical protein
MIERKRPAITVPAEKVPPHVHQTQLVQIIGYSVVTINKWRKYYDDFPDRSEKTGLYDVRKVKAWLEKHPEVGQAGIKVGVRREDLMCENLEKRNAVLDKQLAEADHILVNIDRVMAAIAMERAISVESFRKRMLSELPSELEGKSAREISTGLNRAFTEFIEDVQAAIPRIVKATHI